MKEIIFQYALVILLVFGLGYLIYIIKDKGLQLFEDYFGFTYAILNTLQSDESTKENMKNILRMVSEAVRYVEVEFLNSPNEIKEQKALKLSRSIIKNAGFESHIDDNSIRYLIRICAAMLPCKQDVQNKKFVNTEYDKIFAKLKEAKKI